eukprot:9565235-Ditylum_brightwellii.AAC.1
MEPITLFSTVKTRVKMYKIKQGGHELNIAWKKELCNLAIHGRIQLNLGNIKGSGIGMWMSRKQHQTEK